MKYWAEGRHRRARESSASATATRILTRLSGLSRKRASSPPRDRVGSGWPRIFISVRQRSIGFWVSYNGAARELPQPVARAQLDPDDVLGALRGTVADGSGCCPVRPIQCGCIESDVRKR